jgi:prepilin-type N-terminal cleavage/methylation domain-containing protein/prepilin-type processing-associated H-X9-DG protein
MKRKAFTLIELLVVIAIIAILAAILFPVFAQAKAAAKKAASISNGKQIALAQLMYSGDYDDTFVVEAAWDPNNAPAFFGGYPFQPWTWLVLPYQKNGDIDHDPQAPPNDPWPSTWGTLLPKVLHPQYGYNYTYLSPLLGNSPIINGGGGFFSPLTTTAVEKPAETVMHTAKFSTAEDAPNLGPTSAYWYGGPGLVTSIGVDTPHCTTIPQWCFGNWGTGGFWDTTYLTTTVGQPGIEAAGARTGGMSLRAGNQANVTWTDGHTSTKAAGAMALGTNWTRTQPNGNVVINDLNKYVWDSK